MPSLKSLLFTLAGKQPDAVVVSFASGDPQRAAAMAREVHALTPGRRHLLVCLDTPISLPGIDALVLPSAPPGELWLHLRRALRPYRIGLAPLLLDAPFGSHPLHTAAGLLAPHRLLAFNARGERHHLRLTHPIASWLFLRGVPLDRIWLRPRWLWPFRRDRSTWPATMNEIHGPEPTPGRPRVAVLTPYYPYPPSHGGAVRMHALLREASTQFDLFLFSFTEPAQQQGHDAVRDLFVRQFLFPLPRYREPRWASLRPAEVAEFSSHFVRASLDRLRRQWAIQLTQIEYTQLAAYAGDILVEHDVTFDLYAQVHARHRRLATAWDLWRWRRFERRAVRRFPQVIAMSAKDVSLLNIPHAVALPNGVDLQRFTPAPEPDSARLLFVGSFRHFPNVEAYRFLLDHVWPRLHARHPRLTLTVVAGPDHEAHWRAHSPGRPITPDSRVTVHGFVADVTPLYRDCLLVLVPTVVSAGTNLKVLEAMAMQRAVVSTSSGCAGLTLVHGESVWVADDPAAFAGGVTRLLDDSRLRLSLARAARRVAEQQYDWRALGRRQAELWNQQIRR